MNICSSNNFKTQESIPFNWGCFTQEADILIASLFEKKSLDILENKIKKIVRKIKKADYNKNYRKLHKAEISKAQKTFYQNHKAEISKTHKNYRKNHKAQKAKYDKVYNQNHKAQKAEYHREYYEKNKTYLSARRKALKSVESMDSNETKDFS